MTYPASSPVRTGDDDAPLCPVCTGARRWHDADVEAAVRVLGGVDAVR